LGIAGNEGLRLIFKSSSFLILKPEVNALFYSGCSPLSLMTSAEDKALKELSGS
jgi:hypothetical protein